jgi:hypothetical protein
MPSAVRLREDYSAEELRTLARRSKGVSHSRRPLSLAAVRDGMDRAAAKIGGHGSPDAARLGSSLQRFGARRVSSTTGRKVASLAYRRNSWLSLRRSWRRARTARKMAWSGGGASISSVSLSKGSASTFIRAMSESSCRSLASRTSLPSTPSQAGAEHRKRVPPIVLIHLCRTSTPAPSTTAARRATSGSRFARLARWPYFGCNLSTFMSNC